MEVVPNIFEERIAEDEESHRDESESIGVQH